MRTDRIWLAALFALVVVAFGCGEPEVKKLNITRAEDLQPIAPAQTTPDPLLETTTTEAPVAEDGTPMEILEVGGFRGQCDHTIVGVNEADVVAMRKGNAVASYRLAGISIPDDARFQAHNRIRYLLERKQAGIELEPNSPGLDRAAYLYVCPDGTMVNLELVREGLAVPSDAVSMHKGALDKASIEALTAGRGVWGLSGS